MVRRSDPFKPPADAVYTNGDVNRAGQLLRRWYLRPNGQTPGDFGTSLGELVDAMVAVTWWRGLHARPLSRVLPTCAITLPRRAGKSNNA